MKWGTRWGDPWGAVEDTACPALTGIALERVPAFGPYAYRLSWTYDWGFKWGRKWGTPWGRSANWFKVYVNGVLVATTRATTAAFTASDAGTIAVAIVVVGPLNGDPSYDPGCTAVAGDRVALTWTRPAADDDLSRFRVYWDSGTGTVSYASPLAVVRALPGTTAFSWTSGPLADGTYKFVVRSVDLAGNEETNTTTATVAIATWPAQPTSLAYSYSAATKKVTLTWGGGATCNVYSNGGSGAIDYTAAEASGQTSPWTSSALTGPGTFLYGVRADSGTYEEKNTEYIEFELDAAEAEVTRPSSPYGLAVAQAAGGEFTVTGLLDPRRPTIRGRKPAAAADVSIYHDNATGTMDWGTPLATGVALYARAGGRYAFEHTTTGGAYADGATVQFGARAATSGNVEDENTETASGVADATAPGAPTALAGAAVRAREGTG